jgi:hypothetical protein
MVHEFRSPRAHPQLRVALPTSDEPAEFRKHPVRLRVGQMVKVRSLAFLLVAVPLASLRIAPTASAQVAPRKPLAEEHLERLQDPPISIVPRRIETTPKMVSPFGPYTSYQVNVDANGNNIVGDAANEPSICLDPTNPNRMAIGWRQFDNVASNFRQAGWAFTTNGGLNWTFPGVLQNGVFRSDPVLNSATTGQFYYLSLLQSFFDDMWRSVNGGQDWQNIGPATGGDKEWFTIDNSTSPGHGFHYQVWSTAGNNYNGRQFSRSTNGGATWENPVGIPQSPIWGTLDVDTNGNVFTSGVNTSTGQIWCIRSSNAKNAAVTPTFDQTTAVNLGGDVVGSQRINPEGLVGQINLVIDHSGTSTNNNIYMLGSLQRTGAFTGSDVMFVRSTNGGQSFSAPVRINDDPINPNKWHWFGALAVAPSGRIDCVWLDTRNATNNTDSQLFYSFSTDGGQTWAANVPVSNLFNPFLGYPNQNKIGDYISVVSDNSGANVAYPATFNGEEDVYFVHIPAGTCDAAMTSAETLPAGWITQNNSGSGGTGWFQGDGTVFPSRSGVAGSYIAADFHSAIGSGTISNWLLSPAVTLQNGGKLTFYTRTIDNPSHPDRLQVRMSLNGDSANVGAAPDSVGDFSTVLLDINPNYVITGYPTTWTQYTATITGLVKPVTGRLAFRYFVENGGTDTSSANSEYIGLDTIQFSCTPAFTIAVSASPAGAGSLSGAGRYPSGSNVTVSERPGANVTFVNWTENGSVVSTSSSYNFTATADRNLVANFIVTPRIAASPVILPNGGTFRRKVMVKITDSTPGATIYYTTDGSDPTTASAVFPRGKRVRRIPITGAGIHTVKAMAVAPGFDNSPIASATFTIN